MLGHLLGTTALSALLWLPEAAEAVGTAVSTAGTLVTALDRIGEVAVDVKAITGECKVIAEKAGCIADQVAAYLKPAGSDE